MKLAGGVAAGRDIDAASAGLAAEVDGFLQGWAGVVGFDAGGAEVPDVADGLGGDGNGGSEREQKKNATWVHPNMFEESGRRRQEANGVPAFGDGVVSG